jgi:D-alanyl-D-alanine carboxypeptidase
MKAAQLLERGFSSNSGLSWLMPPLGTVDTIQPVNAAPPNLREEMCGSHRKRPAAENEDDLIPASTAPDSPYGVFLASLRPRMKGAPLLQEVNAGEPVLVFTGAKPPAPGTVQALPGETKPRKKKTAAKPGAGRDIANAAPTTPTAQGSAETVKPKPKATGQKPAAKPAANPPATPAANPTTKPAAKPAPKPAAKPAATPSQQTSQAQ